MVQTPALSADFTARLRERAEALSAEEQAKSPGQHECEDHAARILGARTTAGLFSWAARQAEREDRHASQRLRHYASQARSHLRRLTSQTTTGKTGARTRGAGRPRAQASRRASTSRDDGSGPGDDDPGEPAGPRRAILAGGGRA